MSMEIYLRQIARRTCACTLALFAAITPALAQETVCARVKIEIKQELTLERQAFDAEMKIHNTTDTGVIENVSVVVKVTDEAGTPVAVTSDPNDLSAKFYLRLANRQNISAVDGSGTVSPRTTSIINWLLIPAPGSAGSNPAGKKYLVGATLRYRFGGEDTVLEVAPDVITVKPLPLLTLDYFLTQDVWADDPLTAAVEPAEPFTLGVRVKNNGQAAAKKLRIDSAQPKIIENNQGLLINFLITGSYLNDAPVQNSLLIDFGEIPAQTSKMGRWVMETTLAGRFTEFSARFSHSDELGGAVTSLLQATNAHFLLRDVRVDLPGRDLVRDFLAQDGDVIRVYESDGPDTEVTDRSALAALSAAAGSSSYRLTFPATSGFAYVRLPDPFHGTKAPGRSLRSDAKQLLPENVWLSKTRNAQTKAWEYWINFFDVNTSGVYDIQFQAPPAAARAPVLGSLADRVTQEGQQVSFLVEASSPDGKALTLSASPLPTGAAFIQQAADPASPGLTRAVFDWTPARGSAGSYLLTYSASDGTLVATRSASIRVQSASPPPGPGTPTIEAPLSGAQLTTLRPVLSVNPSTSAQDPTTQLQFEVYSDEARTQLVASSLVDKVPASAGAGEPLARATSWQLPADLRDNQHYWWRARGFGAALYSPWANGRFFVNLYNDAPESFNPGSPAPGAEVGSRTPQLTWSNSVDRDGDAISYSVFVYRDQALTQPVAQVADIAQSTAPDAASTGSTGSTSWQVTPPLTNHVKYHWRVIAKDALGAQTPAAARSFTVNTGNTAPSAPLLASPALGGQTSSAATALTIENSVDAEGDLITYVFEIDSVNSFDSSDKKSSGQVIAGSAGTRWTASDLAENRRYWWRVKAQDGRAESAWVVGNFLMNAANDAPPTPTVKNPGNGAWSAVQQPSLEANPVLDPEGDALRYQFEVFSDAALTRMVAQGTADNPSWLVPTALADKTTHWWRVRALDAHAAASAWGPPALLYVSTAPYQQPSIALTAPATPVQPEFIKTAAGARKQLTIRWEGTDPNIEPSIALYYSSQAGVAGNLIVDGLRQSAGVQTGSYQWDASDLAPGAYHIYAVIYDARGAGKAWAPGALVVAPAQQAGAIVVDAAPLLRTSEKGDSASYWVHLARAPLADVVLPLSSGSPGVGSVSPASLIFTPANWQTRQKATVTGRNDCVANGDQRYQVNTGAAQSMDPDYIGLNGRLVTVLNIADNDLPYSTNNPSLHICALTLVSERRINAGDWEYVLRAELTNTGPAVSGVLATLRGLLPRNSRKGKYSLRFGAVAEGETVKTHDSIVLHSYSRLYEGQFRAGTKLWYRWDVVAQ